ncbi:Thioredoxin-like fold [Phytophthora cactorum]|nr:Thioredoxin-like fold [Phytophthora cactorum]
MASRSLLLVAIFLCVWSLALAQNVNDSPVLNVESDVVCEAATDCLAQGLKHSTCRAGVCVDDALFPLSHEEIAGSIGAFVATILARGPAWEAVVCWCLFPGCSASVSKVEGIQVTRERGTSTKILAGKVSSEEERKSSSNTTEASTEEETSSDENESESLMSWGLQDKRPVKFLSVEEIAKARRTVPIADMGVLLLTWVGLVLFSMAKGGHGTPSVIGLSCGTTSSSMILFTSSATTIQFIILGTLSVDHALWHGAVGFVAGLIGQLGMSYLIKKYRKSALVIFLVAVFIGVSGLFAAMKESLPLGQLPVLEVDGEVFTQSHAIMRFAGRMGGLYPVTAPYLALKIDELLHAMGEIDGKMGPSFREPDADKKKALREELASVTIPRYAALCEARLEKMKQIPVFQSQGVFIHDVAIYAWVKSLRAGYIDDIPTTVLDGYKLLNETHDKVANHPKVKEWYTLQHNAPKLKLTYMPHPGRGEPIRLAFYIGGVEFEDERITREELANRKPSLPFNQLPVLEVDGEVIAQSLAILRYAGTLSGCTR